jgi:hypothetical protein
VRNRLPAHDGNQGIEFAQQEIGGRGGLERETGVHHVRARQAHVDEAGIGANSFADGPEERDQVMIDFALDLLHPLEITRRGANERHCAVRDPPAPVPSLTGSLLHRQPGIEFVRLAPDFAHLRAGIALNQPCYPFSLTRFACVS